MKTILFLVTISLLITATSAFSVAPQDLGDAPDPPYPTLVANDGARHQAFSSTLMLGEQRDTEPDGQPTANADGDDTTGTPDDEDGITFTSAVAPGADATVNVVVSGGPGVLNAWIDFNADGDWGDAGEQIFTDYAVATGTNSLTYQVPADATETETFARFRLDTIGGLTPTGYASVGGEVEDYKVSIGKTFPWVMYVPATTIRH